MRLTRHQLTLLLNALATTGTKTIPIEHPCNEVGELLEVHLRDPLSSTVRFTQGALSYQDSREAVLREYGEAPYQDLPQSNDYVAAMIAGGLTDIGNLDEIKTFLDRHGYPDLEAGHRPVFAGIDANLFPWRIQKAIGIDPQTGTTDENGRDAVNGYALATGVKEELDWHYKHYETRTLTDAFGEEFERLSDQPAGDSRQGFLGRQEYQRITSERRFDIVESGTGDAEIIDGYQQYLEEQRNDLLLFTNDYGFVDMARDNGLNAHHVEIPVDLPPKTSASWWSIENTLYYLAVAFGVLTLPKVTVYGVWNGKQGKHWQDEMVDVVPRSPKVERILERYKQIVDSEPN
jgi:hypothetical protein